MKKRVITGAILFIAMVAAIALRQLSVYIFDAIILVLSTAAAVEIAKCLNIGEKKAYPILSGIFNGLVYAVFLTGLLCKLSGGWVMILEINLLIVTALCVLVYELVQYKKTKRFNTTLFSLVYPSFLFMFFYFINHYYALYSIDAWFGFMALIMVFAVSSVTDSAAMLVGRTLKGPKLCPKISPGKTISGSLGGLVFGTLTGWLAFVIFNAFTKLHNLFVLTEIKAWMFIIIAFAGSLFNQIGDLFESKFKRILGVKDSGNFFPGHGGFMDRYDGVSFNVVATFLLFLLFLT